MSNSILSPAKRTGKRAPVVTGGALSYRTVLMTEARVIRAYAMYAANARFRDVNMICSPTSPGNGYVTFRPANPNCEAAMLNQFQTDRERRATDALDADLTYEWDTTGENDGSEVCFSPRLDKKTGEVTYEPYIVSPTECDCPDWHYRCRRLNVECKHQIAQRLRREKGF